MKCSLCGGDATFVQHFINDGVEKKIAFCRHCFMQMVKYQSSSVRKSGMALLKAHAHIVQESPAVVRGELISASYHAQILVPLILIETLFESDELTHLRAKRTIAERELFYLGLRFNRAVRSQRFEEAQRLKAKMKRLESFLRGESKDSLQ